MPNLKLYQYAILLHPAKDDKKGKTKLIVEPTTVLAASDNVAQMMAVKSIPEQYADQLEDIDIAIRPF